MALNFVVILATYLCTHFSIVLAMVCKDEIYPFLLEKETIFFSYCDFFIKNSSHIPRNILYKFSYLY